MSFLTLADVSKVYGSATVVSHLSLSVAKGEFVSLLGPSGCGKTTTLQMIAGFTEVSSGRIQLYIKGDDIGADLYASFKHWDLGDIVGAEGKVFKTKTGELSIHASSLRLLTKSLRPLPDKFHGLADAVLGHERAVQLADAVLNLDKSGDVNAMMRLGAPMMAARLAGE